MPAGKKRWRNGSFEDSEFSVLLFPDFMIMQDE
jgi:hypothetical protein